MNKYITDELITLRMTEKGWIEGCDDEHAKKQVLDHYECDITDPTRRKILTLLLEDDMAVTDVAEPFEMSLAAISKHLSVLTNAGLIQQERRGRVKWCKLDPDAMQVAWAWMQGFGHFDPLDLDGLEAYIEKTLHKS